MLKKLIIFFLLVTGKVLAQPAFSKYFTNSPNGSQFHVIRELDNHQGYLMLGERYTTQRQTFLIRTDTALNETWSRRFVLASPFDNTQFFDLGQFPTGEYYIIGDATVSGIANTVLFVLDSNGLVLHQTAMHETTHSASFGWLAHTRICSDSSLLVSAGEYEWAGFFRFDHNLNLLSSGFSQSSSNTNTAAHDCIELSDGNLAYPFTGSASGVVKCTKQGTILWSKEYVSLGSIFSIYEGNDRSIYLGGIAANASLSKLDSAGNLLWSKSYDDLPYCMCNAVVRNIFPMANGHLLLYTDSLFFETDTAGNPLTPGYVIPQYSLGELRPAGPDFLFCSDILQPVGWMPTVMRFSAPSGSTCAWPRSLAITNESPSPLTSTVSAMSPVFSIQSVAYIDTPAVFGYDPVPGCPLGPAGINEQKPATEISCYPNPAGEETYFQFTAAHLPGDITITDFTGRIIVSEKISSPDFQLSTAGFPPGIYFVKIQYSNGTCANSKFSVVH